MGVKHLCTYLRMVRWRSTPLIKPEMLRKTTFNVSFSARGPSADPSTIQCKERYPANQSRAFIFSLLFFSLLFLIFDEPII